MQLFDHRIYHYAAIDGSSLPAMIAHNILACLAANATATTLSGRLLLSELIHS